MVGAIRPKLVFLLKTGIPASIRKYFEGDQMFRSQNPNTIDNSSASHHKLIKVIIQKDCKYRPFMTQCTA